MEIIIWFLKGLLAALFAFTGVSKLFFPKAKLLDMGMKGLVNLEAQQIKLAGLLEVLGVVGLVLPSLLNIYPILSGIAALCLGLTMVVATRIHLQLKLSIVPNLVTLAMCLLVAYQAIASAM